MKRFSKAVPAPRRVLPGALCLTALAGCALSPSTAATPAGTPAAKVVIAPDPGTARPPFEFSDDDNALLEDVQHGCFNYLWSHVSPHTGMVYDRTSADLVSVAGVGFQLSAIPVGIKHGWITEDQGRERCARILSSLLAEPTNRVHGLYFHFLDDDARPHPEAYEHVVSTIDSALLFAGVITASSYFGGEVATLGDRILDEADWHAFLATNADHPAYTDFITLGWRADDKHDPTRSGKLLKATWADAGDEHKLVTFLAVSAPNPEHRVPPETYYKLRRTLGDYPGVGVHVWLPYSGALFTVFFAQCWIDYAHLGVDHPAAFGQPARAQVDWWENGRRFAKLHEVMCKENPEGFKTLGGRAWGLSACDGPDGYLVAQLKPHLVAMPDARENYDVPPKAHLDDHPVWNGAVVAPYAAGGTVVFDPGPAIDALRYYRSLERADGTPLLWEDPSKGGWGFFDSYTLDTKSGDPWVAPDRVAIDEGPLILLIENARSGFVWDLFMSHPMVRAGLERLRLERSQETAGGGSAANRTQGG